MFKQTSCYTFNKYGHILSNINSDIVSSKDKLFMDIIDNSINKLFVSDQDIYIKLKKGVVLLLVSYTPNSDNIDTFVLNKQILLNKGIYYNFVPISNDCQLEIYLNKNNLNLTSIDKPYTYKEIVPTININKIYTKFYQEKPVNYLFKGEKHNFWEFTFVDRGILYTNINGQEFKLKQNDILFYAPNQYHNQYTDEKKPSSYLTISFDMTLDDHSLLSNKVFSCDKNLYAVIHNIIYELNSDNLYKNELIMCYLKQIILKILSSNINKSFIKPTNTTQQIYDNEILKEILDFIDSNIYTNLTINEICNKFNISSSKLHLLFKNNMSTTAKAYINNLKLKQSKDLIKEYKYSIGEISEMMGFNSIHYFSNSFKKKYGVSPSEYLKSINKLV